MTDIKRCVFCKVRPAPHDQFCSTVCAKSFYGTHFDSGASGAAKRSMKRSILKQKQAGPEYVPTPNEHGNRDRHEGPTPKKGRTRGIVG